MAPAVVGHLAPDRRRRRLTAPAVVGVLAGAVAGCTVAAEPAADSGSGYREQALEAARVLQDHADAGGDDGDPGTPVTDYEAVVTLVESDDGLLDVDVPEQETAAGWWRDGRVATFPTMPLGRTLTLTFGLTEASGETLEPDEVRIYRIETAEPGGEPSVSSDEEAAALYVQLQRDMSELAGVPEPSASTD